MSFHWIVWSILVLILSLSLQPLSQISKFQRSRGDDDLWILFSILAAGTLLWILIARQIVTHISNDKLILFGIVWPVLFGIFQMVDFYYDRWETLQDPTNNRRPLVQSIREETSTLISFIFAMGAILFAVGNKEKINPAIRLMLVALVLSIGFIATTHWLGNHFDRSAIVWKSIQRVLVNFVTGFLLCALIIIFTAIQ